MSDADALGELGLHWTDVVGEFEQMHMQNRVLLTFLAANALFAYQYGKAVSERDKNVLLETRNLLDQIGVGALFVR